MASVKMSLFFLGGGHTRRHALLWLYVFVLFRVPRWSIFSWGRPKSANRPSTPCASWFDPIVSVFFWTVKSQFLMLNKLNSIFDGSSSQCFFGDVTMFPIFLGGSSSSFRGGLPSDRLCHWRHGQRENQWENHWLTLRCHEIWPWKWPEDLVLMGNHRPEKKYVLFFPWPWPWLL